MGILEPKLNELANKIRKKYFCDGIDVEGYIYNQVFEQLETTDFKKVETAINQIDKYNLEIKVYIYDNCDDLAQCIVFEFNFAVAQRETSNQV